MTHRNTLIRRIPDDTGALVTYLPLMEVAEVVSVSKSTVSAWGQSGAVRITTLLKGARNYAVVDAVKLRAMTPAQSLELGIRRRTDAAIAKSRKYLEGEQSLTRPLADQHAEIWDGKDDEFLIAHAGKCSFEEIAVALGRTYKAVHSRLNVLKHAGDIEFTAHVPAESWLDDAMLLLTPRERESLRA